MQAWLKDDDGQLMATVVNGAVYVAPGADREMVAFELFKLMTRLMSPGLPNVTWGHAWMSGNMGTPTSPGS